MLHSRTRWWTWSSPATEWLVDIGGWTWRFRHVAPSASPHSPAAPAGAHRRHRRVLTGDTVRRYCSAILFGYTVRRCAQRCARGGVRVVSRGGVRVVSRGGVRAVVRVTSHGEPWRAVTSRGARGEPWRAW